MENRRASSSKAVKNPMAEAGSLCVFALSVFSLFALLSYNAADPSWFSNGRGLAQNACGRMGALVSSLFLQGFGMGAFLLPAALFFVSVTIHKREGATRVIGTLGGMTIAVMSLTVFLTLQWKYWPYAGTLILTGGAFGAWVAESMIRELNSLGSSIVSLLVFCLAIALSTPVSVAKLGASVIRAVFVVCTRAVRVAGTYLLYLGGLLAMRAAHAAGDLLQKLIEGAIRRGRERASAIKAVATRKTEIDVDAEIEVDAGAVRALPDKRKSRKKASEDEDEEDVIGIAALAQAAGEKDGSASSAAPTDLIIAPVSNTAVSDARNVLADFESAKATAANFKKAKAGPDAPAGAEAAASSASKMPEILPHEKNAYVDPALGLLGAAAKAEMDGHGNIDGAIAAKVAQKLARAKKALKVGQWKLPLLDFLKNPPKIESNIDKAKIMANAQLLTQKLKDFGVDGEITAVRPGPVITLYEFKPAAGIKVSRIANLVNDLSMALSAQSVRILAPIPGKSVVGIEIPSDNRETVYTKEFLQHPDFFSDKFALPVVMGKDIGGTTYLSDLAKMPHLLCAGQTGSGKSVFMNGLICSLLYRYTPDELRMILIDPKFIEFSAYQNIPHLLLPVVDDPKNAATALRWAVQEMERRYRILAKVQVRNLASFNQKVDEIGNDKLSEILLATEEGEDDDAPASPVPSSGSDWQAAFELNDDGGPRVGKLPYIVVIIDELADLMMIAKKEVEISIARIAQKARAAGIHLVIATQRPSTDIITGLIKANLPSRVSFRLASQIDSRTILDHQGAERLLGQGDMLFIPPGAPHSIRLHGAYLSDDEIGKITAFLKEQGKPAYRDEILLAAGEEDDEDGPGGGGAEDEDDELFQEAIELVKHSGHASASYLQRHLKVGYNRAARMIETMESRGVVGPADGARPRQVLIR
jgi:S-DNA-T family DNA segregation ATPase FtsK/SpoIIIE